MKILLVNQKEYQREECCTGKISYNQLPSQIILAANYLKEKGKEITFIDEQTQTIPNLEKFDVVITWVSVLSGFYNDIKILKEAKKIGKKTIIVLNDPQGVELEVMKEYKFIDACIRLYEREIALDKLLTSWEKETKIDFPGVIYRKGEEVLDKGTMPFAKDLTHLKSSVNIMEELPLSKYREAFITTGRGCPMVCTFCSYPATSSRKRNTKDILEEIELVSSNMDYYSFIDLNLYANRKWADNFLDKLIERKFPGGWVGDMHAATATKELVQKWKKAGCIRILTGIESFDNYALKKMKKGINQKIIVQAIRNMQSADLSPITSLIVGLPWDSNQSLKKTEKFIKKMGITLFGTSYLVPTKGTQIYSEMRADNLIKELTVHDYVNATEYPTAPTLHLSKKEVVNWSKRLQKIRFNPEYMFNYVKHNGFKARYIFSLAGRIKNYYAQT